MTTDAQIESKSKQKIEQDSHKEFSITQRLQKEVESIQSIGFKSQPWKADSESTASIATLTLDVNWLIAQRELPYLIQALPPSLLYRSLIDHGIEDSLEVVEWIRGGALVRLLDFDLWSKSQSDADSLTADEQPSGERFLQWIRWWNEINPEFATQRLVELDEGLIVGCLTALCEIIPVGLTRNQEELSDDYWVTPDNRFGLKMKTNQDADFEVFHQFVHSLYKQNIRLAQSVLAHSAMLIREESVEEARCWRSSRLEEQGFLQADEARQILSPKTNKQLAEIVQRATKTEKNLYARDSNPEHAGRSDDKFAAHQQSEILERILEFVQQRDSEELAEEIEQTLGTSEIVRLIGTSAPQAEILIQDEDVMDAFISKVTNHTQQILVSLEAHKARLVSKQLHESKTRLLIDDVMVWLSENQLDSVVDYKSRIARTTNTVASAFAVAHDSTELSRVLVMVRGCLNIGLERLLKNPENFALSLMELERPEIRDELLRTVSLAAQIFSTVGPEALFQVGWQTLQELASDATQTLVYVVEHSDQFKTKVSSNYVVRLSDGESLNISVLQLQARGRYSELRKWLGQLETFFEPSVQHILESTLNRLPVFPILVDDGGKMMRGTTSVKPYETLEEVEKTRIFLRHLPSVIASSTHRGIKC